MIAKAVSILTMAGIVGTGFYWIDGHYAKQLTVAGLAKRLEKKIDDDEIYYTQRRIWQIKDRFGDDCGKAKNECRELKEKIDRLKTKRDK